MHETRLSTADTDPRRQVTWMAKMYTSTPEMARITLYDIGLYVFLQNKNLEATTMWYVYEKCMYDYNA